MAALVALGALIALRGPDWIGPSLAEATGHWRLQESAPWRVEAPLAAVASVPYALAGPRGWQNAHVIIPWLALLAWLWVLPAKAWRGLAPIAPALAAVLLSTEAAGLAGFGLAVAVMSGWHALTFRRTSFVWAAGTFPVVAALAVWFSPGALPVVLAAALVPRGGWRRGQHALLVAVGLVAVHFTPRGFVLWQDAWIFVRWSPQGSWTLPVAAALLATLVVLGLAVRASWKDGQWGRVAGPGLLMLCAMAGQMAYWWAAALWMIPCWPAAREHVQRFGFRVRWYMQLTALIVAGLLVFAQARLVLPRWYDLAMNPGVMIPTLTYDTLPEDGPVYINPQGRALARFRAALPPEAAQAGAAHLGREPSLWRAFDRRERHRAVWLLGDKADYAPLARHLGDSPDWRLEAVDATGVLFVRAPRKEIFATEPAQEVARRMTGGANRSGFLARAALACLAGQALPEAGELSVAALRRSDESSQATAARARVLISLGRPREALEVSAQAVALNPRSSEAWQVRAEAFLHAELPDSAYAAAQRALALAPGDTGALWLAARTANAARALQSEADLLERLVAQTAARGGDPGFYQFYLGQSYARQGLARPAVRALEAAARAPGLSDEQRAEIQEQINDLLSAPGAP